MVVRRSQIDERVAVTGGNTHNEEIPSNAKKRVMRKFFVPLEEHAKQGASTSDCDEEKNVVYVTLNKGSVQDALHTWISVTLGIGINRTNMD